MHVVEALTCFPPGLVLMCASDVNFSGILGVVHAELSLHTHNMRRLALYNCIILHPYPR